MKSTNKNGILNVYFIIHIYAYCINLCRKTCLELLECPWSRIACLVTIAVCLLMARYELFMFCVFTRSYQIISCL